MSRRRSARAATQHHLAHHELAVIFGGDAFKGLKAGIGVIGRARPFPHLTVIDRSSGRFPFKFGGQPRPRPVGVGARIREIKEQKVVVAASLTPQKVLAYHEIALEAAHGDLHVLFQAAFRGERHAGARRRVARGRRDGPRAR